MAVMFVFHCVVFGWLSHFLYTGLFGTRKSYSDYVSFSSQRRFWTAFSTQGCLVQGK